MCHIVAGKAIEQAEAEVKTKLHTAFNLAEVIKAIACEQQDDRLLEILLAHFVVKCPFVIPQYIGVKCGESRVSYLRRLGYRVSKDTASSSSPSSSAGWKTEDDRMYHERMCGILGLYAALTQASVGGTRPDLYPITHAWVWLARITNMRSNPFTPTLIQTFLEVAGQPLLNAYPNQAPKLVNAIIQKLPEMQSLDHPIAKSGVSRLQNYLEKYMGTRQLESARQ
ncbi:hypothetical protein EV182_005855 [Spiromyces aspiralis]|uniref:Uncharacterized protein n=1 Tax=Spiromyces aspiralis TaxID=68401 RepID=A0ACC1HUM4_9FUNG|nr:hypothetical protein EV182_005855 [Spiromyces aspiralis]